MSGIEFIPMGHSEKPPRAVWLAPLSVMLGSLMTLVPVIAVVPFLPPFGLMVLLGWRMVRGDSMRVWMPVLLGFFDDMVSGQPLGSAMLLWTVCVLAIDVLDTRLVWRDFWQDWLIASGAIGYCLIAGRLALRFARRYRVAAAGTDLRGAVSADLPALRLVRQRCEEALRC